MEHFSQWGAAREGFLEEVNKLEPKQELMEGDGWDGEVRVCQEHCMQRSRGGSDRGVGWGRLWRVPLTSILTPGSGHLSHFQAHPRPRVKATQCQLWGP